MFGGDEWFFAGHYPSHPLVPGVLLCEAAMQCGAILLSPLLTNLRSVPGEGQGERVPVATRISDVRFKRMVRPGEKIVMEVELVERLADAFFLKAKVTVENKVAVRFEFACTAVATPAGQALPDNPTEKRVRASLVHLVVERRGQCTRGD